MNALRAALAAALARLAAAGVPDPARDARVLLAHAAGIAADRLSLHMDDALTPDAAARFDVALTARAARQPVAQITGGRDFWRHRFIVTPDVLDPRPETETLVAEALRAPFARLLDLGTGSGAILLSLLAERPAATGLGTDLSHAALGVARRNAQALGLADRAAFALSDWFADVAGRFDLIVSNPPYIAAAEIPGLAPEVRDWEPRLALTPRDATGDDPGGDGLAAYRAIALRAPAHLAPGGRLMVEIGPTQGAAVAALFTAAGLTDVAVLPDLDGRDRVVRGRAG
jgi:release factor glutamine methyltransferase